MKMKKAASAAACVLLCAAAAACGGGSDDGSNVGIGGGNRVQLADREAKKVDPRARIVWAGGRMLSGGALANPGDADTWDFHAVAAENGEVAGQWELTLLVEQWQIEPLQWPPMQIEYIDLTTIALDVEAAWAILEQQGQARPFFTWELFKPLNSSLSNACYAFYVGDGQYLFVDAARGGSWSGTALAGGYAGGAAGRGSDTESPRMPNAAAACGSSTLRAANTAALPYRHSCASFDNGVERSFHVMPLASGASPSAQH